MSSEQNPDGRYTRQLIMPEIGVKGQERLRRAGVLVVGAGGLGSAVCYYLAAAGIGRLGLADGDRVELSNLQRQILHTVNDLGRPKVESARDRLGLLNPETEVEVHFLRVAEDNAAALAGGYDLVVSAVDNLDTRYLLNSICHALGKTLVDGAVGGFSGQMAVFTPPGPCYRCLYPARGQDTKRVPRGVLGAVAGIIGTLQAAETIKILLGLGAPAGHLLVYDGLRSVFTDVAFATDPHCPVCGPGNRENAPGPL